jgi:hypothetical protein
MLGELSGLGGADYGISLGYLGHTDNHFGEVLVRARGFQAGVVVSAHGCPRYQLLIMRLLLRHPWCRE